MRKNRRNDLPVAGPTSDAGRLDTFPGDVLLSPRDAMAKQVRHKPHRTSRKRALERSVSVGRKTPAPPVPQVQTATLERKSAAPPPPSAPPKKPGYYEAVAIYETGV